MQLNLDGKTVYDLALERLRAFEPPEGYYLCFSGGKDSQTVYHLAQEAGVRFDAHYQRAVEPPEVYWFVKRQYPDVAIELPEQTMWQLIAGTRHSGFPPSRVARYCCEHLKERGGDGRLCVTGIRWQESTRRKARRMAEAGKHGKRFLHPIIDWQESDVWEYLDGRGIPHCSLYDDGWKRLGCVMCPMSGSHGMARDAARWPKIADGYLRAIRRGYRGQYPEMPTADDVFAWWVSGKANGQEELCDGFLFEG